jgi:hypothetical protein
MACGPARMHKLWFSDVEIVTLTNGTHKKQPKDNSHRVVRVKVHRTVSVSTLVWNPEGAGPVSNSI